MDKKQLCFMVDISKPRKRPVGEKTLSALKMEKGLRRGEHINVVALIKIRPEKHVEVATKK